MIYDRANCIEAYLTDLDGLNRLIKDRAEAGYTRHERLHDFIILGRWSTDSCGNFGRCQFRLDYKPVELQNSLPKVVRKEDLFGMFKDLTIEISASSDVPPSHILCPECGKGWTLDNAHDTYVMQDNRTIPLHPGKSIAERAKDWSNNTEGVFRFGPEPSVCNPKFIDLKPHPEYKGQTINEKGWRHHHPPFDHERLTQDYVAEEGDEACITVFLFFHKRCHTIRKARVERKTFEVIFEKAGLPHAALLEIPNEYCPCEACAPWFLARLPFGDIKIGWRKRVINIDWSATGKELGELFTEENVTKDNFTIHAYGANKAADYLGRIKKAFDA
jgi:hypothetical protein